MMNLSIEPQMLPVEEAQQKIFSKFKQLDLEKKDLINSLGHFLGEDVIAPFDLPEKNNSAMDGFAAKYLDVENCNQARVKLQVVGRVGAENVSNTILKKGQAIRIMTGGEIPTGADCVVPFEHTDSGPVRGSNYPSEVVVNKPVALGDNIRKSGLDYKIGEKVLEKGTYLNAPSVGVAASLGIDRILVVRKPIISVLSTGNEIVLPGREKKDGQIYDSNLFSIASAIKEAGGIPNICEVIPDEEDALEKVLDSCSDSDLIVSIGGVSKGDFDLIKDVLVRKGDINFWGIRMRPGKPLAFGELNLSGRKVYQIGLPGNPVSAYVCFELFVRPLILKMRGYKTILRETIRAKIDKTIQNDDQRKIFVRVKLIKHGSKYAAKVYEDQSSNILSSLVFANGLAICPEDCKVISSGDLVDVMTLDH